MRLTRAVHLGLALALSAASAMAASRLPLPEKRPYDVSAVPAAGTLRWLFPSHPTLAANLYWLRTVQYIGETRTRERGWGKLFPLADLVTNLDPRHGYAYQVASMILSAAGRIDESNRLLEKGMRNVPERYILPYHRAFNAFYYQNDFEAAGRYAEIAASIPGAPEHLRQNVLAYYVKGKRADLAVRYLEHARQAARDDESRKAIDGQLEQARLEQAAAAVDDAIERYRVARGFGPWYPYQLVAEGFLRELPADPAGGEWIIGDDGRVRSTAHDRRMAPAPRPGEMDPAPGLGRSADSRGNGSPP